MSEYSKPLPHPTEESRPFWEGCKRHELLIQKCRQCGLLINYPKTLCPNDASTAFDWVRASGRGEVYSYTICYRAFHPAFSPDVPYVAAIVELAEGVRLLSNVVGVDPASVHVGMKVQVQFDDVTPEITLPKFQPVAGA